MYFLAWFTNWENIDGVYGSWLSIWEYGNLSGKRLVEQGSMKSRIRYHSAFEDSLLLGPYLQLLNYLPPWARFIFDCRSG